MAIGVSSLAPNPQSGVAAILFESKSPPVNGLQKFRSVSEPLMHIFVIEVVPLAIVLGFRFFQESRNRHVLRRTIYVPLGLLQLKKNRKYITNVLLKKKKRKTQQVNKIHDIFIMFTVVLALSPVLNGRDSSPNIFLNSSISQRRNPGLLPPSTSSRKPVNITGSASSATALPIVSAGSIVLVLQSTRST